MKFSLDAVKNADWKQLAIDHGEKVGFAAALLVAAAVLFGGRWTPYAETQPAGVDTAVDGAGTRSDRACGPRKNEVRMSRLRTWSKELKRYS